MMFCQILIATYNVTTLLTAAVPNSFEIHRLHSFCHVTFRSFHYLYPLGLLRNLHLSVACQANSIHLA